MLWNAYATMKHRPIVRGWPKQNAQLAMTAIGQNLRGAPQTESPSTRKHQLIT